MTATYEDIATVTASGSVSQIDFTSISGSFTDLVLIYNFSYASVPATRYSQMRVGNGSIDTGGNYSQTFLGAQSSVFSSRISNQTLFDGMGVTTAATQSIVGLVHFMNYSNTTTNKTMLCRSNNAGFEVTSNVGLWRSTSAITHIRFFDSGSNNFASGSTFTLYGIKAE
jgi:hypothetical protein